MNCEYYDKIIDYIDDNLSKQEKENFETYLKNNDEFRVIVSDIKTQTKLIKKLPQLKTSSNFIVDLNKRIEEYESQNKYSLLNIFSINKTKIDFIPLLGTMSLLLIISFSLFKVSNYNLSNYNSEENQFDNSVAINDSDSLKNDYDEAPVLLIGNKK